MIFIASTLELNGCTTFLLRACNELHRRGVVPTVLVLAKHNHSNTFLELSRVANVITLNSLIIKIFSCFFLRQLGVFLPLNKKLVQATFSKDTQSFHVMGVFGLIVAKRLSKILGGTPITIGIYHQNEFLYSGGPYFLDRWVRKSICNEFSENIIFFNEGNRESYANRFNKDFLLSQVLPIGIDISSADINLWYKNRVTFLIISVGNLLGFKTYNRHVISCLPMLRLKYSNVRYEIYGEGEDLLLLRELALNLEVADIVYFCGHLDYAQFSQTVSRAHVFVGSGTAILESAILGVPSVVGIESIQIPLTYGFISNVVGFGYNEAGLDLPLLKFIDVIEDVFSANENDLIDISKSCRKKAAEFGVDRMIDGLDISEKNARVQVDFGNLEFFRLFTSFFWISLLDVMGIAKRFRYRRNQGWSE